MMTINALRPLHVSDNKDCVAIALPTWLMHDFMQSMNAYGLVREEFCDFLEPALLSDQRLAACWRLMSSTIQDHERQLRSLRQYMRLQTDTSPFPPMHAVSLAEMAKQLCVLQSAESRGTSTQFHGLHGHYILSHADRAFDILSAFYENALIHARSEVEIAVSCDDKDARIDVVDDGPGLPTEAIDMLGKPFVRIENPLSPKRPGLGLGIHIALAIAARMPGHRVSVSNAPNQGCCFSLTAPLASLNAKSHPVPEDVDPLVGARILILDEDDFFARMLRDLLVSWKCPVECRRAWNEPAQKATGGMAADLLLVSYKEWYAHGDLIVEYLAAMASPPPLVFVLAGPGDSPKMSHPSLQGGGRIGILQRPVSPTRLRSVLTNAMRIRKGSSAGCVASSPP